jgi:hypothetical protein
MMRLRQLVSLASPESRGRRPGSLSGIGANHSGLPFPPFSDSTPRSLSGIGSALRHLGLELPCPPLSDPTPRSLSGIGAALRHLGLELPCPPVSDPTPRSLSGIGTALRPLGLELPGPPLSDPNPSSRLLLSASSPFDWRAATTRRPQRETVEDVISWKLACNRWHRLRA